MKEILGKGFVEIIDQMGDDYRILQAARVSTGSEIKKGEVKDRGLIRYLYKNQHMSPFEMSVFTFHVKIPIAMAVHLIRHRTFSFNFESSRYKEMNMDFYIPENWRKQSKTNKQGSDDIVNENVNMVSSADYNRILEEIENFYSYMLRNDVSREMARFILPESLFTELYFTVDLRNLLHFLDLRLHKHTQKETREFANAIYETLKEIENIKWTMEIFDEMREMNYIIQEMLSSKIEPNKITEYLKDYKNS